MVNGCYVDGGYVYISREFMKLDVFKNADAWMVFMWCMFLAQYEETKVKVGSKIITLHPGQLIISRRLIAESLNMNERDVYKCLNCLEKEGLISVKAIGGWKLVTIIDWDKYEGAD